MGWWAITSFHGVLFQRDTQIFSSKHRLWFSTPLKNRLCHRPLLLWNQPWDPCSLALQMPGSHHSASLFTETLLVWASSLQNAMALSHFPWMILISHPFGPSIWRTSWDDRASLSWPYPLAWERWQYWSAVVTVEENDNASVPVSISWIHANIKKKKKCWKVRKNQYKYILDFKWKKKNYKHLRKYPSGCCWLPHHFSS